MKERIPLFPRAGSSPRVEAQPVASTGACLCAVTIRRVPSLFEHAGGEDALHRLEDAFYASVLADPLLQPLFGEGQPQHVDHLTAFTAESFGGPDRFTKELGGFEGLIAVHRGLRRTGRPRARFAEL